MLQLYLQTERSSPNFRCENNKKSKTSSTSERVQRHISVTSESRRRLPFGGNLLNEFILPLWFFMRKKKLACTQSNSKGLTGVTVRRRSQLLQLGNFRCQQKVLLRLGWECFQQKQHSLWTLFQKHVFGCVFVLKYSWILLYKKDSYRSLPSIIMESFLPCSPVRWKTGILAVCRFNHTYTSHHNSSVWTRKLTPILEPFSFSLFFKDICILSKDAPVSTALIHRNNHCSVT